MDETELGIAKGGSWLLLDVSLAGEENSAMEFPPSTLLTGAEEAKEGSLKNKACMSQAANYKFSPLLTCSHQERYDHSDPSTSVTREQFVIS